MESCSAIEPWLVNQHFYSQTCTLIGVLAMPQVPDGVPEEFADLFNKAVQHAASQVGGDFSGQDVEYIAEENGKQLLKATHGDNMVIFVITAGVVIVLVSCIVVAHKHLSEIRQHNLIKELAKELKDLEAGDAERLTRMVEAQLGGGTGAVADVVKRPKKEE